MVEHSFPHLLAVAAIVLIGPAVPAAAMVANGSFELPGRPVAKQAGYWWEGNTIDAWAPSNVASVGRNTAGHAFFDNGSTPDGGYVAFIQNVNSLTQTVGGFAEGGLYRLSLRANGRALDRELYNRGGTLLVTLNGTALVGPVDVPAVGDAGEFSGPFHEFTSVFRTGAGAYPLVVSQVERTHGVSILIDDVTIEPVEEADVTDEQVTVVNRAVPVHVLEPEVEELMLELSWVWHPADPDPAERAGLGTRYFRNSFELPTSLARMKEARFLLTADNECRVLANGREAGMARDHSRLHEIDIAPFLKPGANTLGLEATNTGDAPNPAGVMGAVIITFSGRLPAVVLPVDERWACAKEPETGWLEPDFDDGHWPRAAAIAEVGEGPWGRMGALAHTVPDDFPRFTVPGWEGHTESLRRLFHLHYRTAGPAATLWDGWLPMSALWPARDGGPGGHAMREAWRAALLNRRIDGEGYVSTHQHAGLAHGEGWPFPTFTQAGGVGWLFSVAGHPYAGAMGLQALDVVDGWELEGAETIGIDASEGWALRLADAGAAIVTPEFDVDSFVAPFLRLEWSAEDLGHGANPYVEWSTEEKDTFGRERRVYFAPPPGDGELASADIPMYRHPAWRGRVRRLRVAFGNAAGARVQIVRFFTAIDTRHPINNPNFIQGSCDYVEWTRDIAFLRDNIGRMRRALRFAMEEFDVEGEGCVVVPWVGHSGRPGFDVLDDGSKRMYPGEGVGNNYWDLMPFGGHDALATIYYYDAVRRMARVEEAIAANPGWGVPAGADVFHARQLRDHAEFVRERFQNLFWNPRTRRFVACIDRDGRAHDYGYTFVNLEAITYGLPAHHQGRSIMDWVTGRRIVPGDTSTGDDIYRWRFAPRASTRRNVDWYVWAWSGPEGIPFGDQVQDGGAVLGFSHHDLMSRLAHNGPDDAWNRLREILDWFGEVREAGGYREYYSRADRGRLQGGGTAGGLGMDIEFVESVLVPQSMLYGFLGFSPRLDGFAIAPRLPSAWPSLEIDRIHLHDVVLSVKAEGDTFTVRVSDRPAGPLSVYLPEGLWRVTRRGPGGDVLTLGTLDATGDLPLGLDVPEGGLEVVFVTGQ